MNMNPRRTATESIGDQIKNLLAADIQTQFGTECRPMIGGFTLIAEYTDAVTGRTHYMSMTDEELTPWVEMGLLRGRMLIVESEWTEGMTVGEREVEG